MQTSVASPRHAISALSSSSTFSHIATSARCQPASARTATESLKDQACQVANAPCGSILPPVEHSFWRAARCRPRSSHDLLSAVWIGTRDSDKRKLELLRADVSIKQEGGVRDGNGGSEQLRSFETAVQKLPVCQLAPGLEVNNEGRTARGRRDGGSARWGHSSEEREGNTASRGRGVRRGREGEGGVPRKDRDEREIFMITVVEELRRRSNGVRGPSSGGEGYATREERGEPRGRRRPVVRRGSTMENPGMGQSMAMAESLNEEGTRKDIRGGVSGGSQAFAADMEKIIRENVRPIFGELQRQKDWQTALYVYDLVKDQSWFKGQGRAYAKLITLLGGARRIHQAQSVFEDMKRHVLHSDSAAYTAIIAAYTRNGMHDRSIDIFEDMKKNERLHPTVHTYGAVVGAFLKRGNVEGAKAIVNEMRANGCPPDGVTYNVLIDGLGRNSCLSEMERLFQEMKRERIAPNRTTFNTLINGFGKAGDIERMEGSFLEMQDAGLEPDVVTFGALINCFGKSGKLQKMEMAAQQMQKSGIAPDLMVFTSMIDAYGKAGRVREMTSVVNRMERARCRPNAHTCSTLISAFGNMGFYDRAEKAYRDWVCNGTGKADVALYNTLADMYAKSETIEKMERVVREMRDEGCRPNLITWNTMVDGYGRVGNLVKMESCYNALLKEGLSPDCTTFTAMIHAFGKRSLYGEMKRIWNCMVENGCNISTPAYGALIDTYGKAGRVSDAEAVLEKMISMGVPLTVVTWTSLIDAYCRAGQYHKVGPTFERMRKENWKGNVLTAASLIAGLSGCEDLEEAQPLIECLRKCQEDDLYVPVMKLMLDKHGSDTSGELEETYKAVDALFCQLSEVEPNEWLQALFSTLTEGLWTFGLIGRSSKVMKFALARGVYPQPENSGSEWMVDLHSMSVGAAQTTLIQWLSEIRQWASGKPLPAGRRTRVIEQFVVVTGWGRHSRKEGESRIRTSVEERLEKMGSPFAMVSNNSGRLFADAEDVRRWVLRQKNNWDNWLDIRDAEDAGPPWAARHSTTDD